MCIYLVLLIHITLGALIHIIRHLLCVETILSHIMCIYLALIHITLGVLIHIIRYLLCRDYYIFCVSISRLIHITLGALIHITRCLLCVATLLLHIMCIYLALDTHYSRRVDTHYSTSVMCRDYFATHYVYLSRADTPYSRRVDTHYSISIMCRDSLATYYVYLSRA